LNSDTNSRKLLAINFGGLGDEVLFLPTLQSIRNARPNWHITLLTEPRGKAIKQLSAIIDDGLVFDIKKRPLKPSDYVDLVSLLRGGKFDVVVSSGSSPQVSGLLFLSGIKQRVGYGSNKLAQLLLTHPVPLNRQQHAACMYHDLAAGLGIKETCARPQISARPEAVERMKQLLRQSTESGAKPLVLIHPGTSKLAIQKGIYKTWSPENWQQLTRRLIASNCRVVLAGGPDDEETVDATVQALEGAQPGITTSAEFFLAYGKTANIDDLVALTDIADLLICVDSAPMHIGVGLNKHLVALFGPTDPAKLLWPDRRFAAIRDEEAATFWGNADPFTQRPERSQPSQPLQPQLAPYVQIPPDTVFQIAMDQLKLALSPDSSQESLP
jgi:ADP-heptose:LPS heptosyltransferase